MKVALSHDWLNGMRGGEKCLEVFCELFPDSEIFTLFYEPGKVSQTISSHRIHTSSVQRFPQVFKRYRHYLPFFPSAIESFDLNGYDLVLSTSHCAAKGIRKPSGATHICYCFTPMRYAWTLFDDYFGKSNFLYKVLVRGVLASLRKWDLKTNAGVDHFVAISRHVQSRIKLYYGRGSDVVYPPVDTDYFTPDAAVRRGEEYLIVSALVPYKNIELAIRAFNRMNKPLRIIGDGPEKAALQRIAGPSISFLGWQSDKILRESYRSAKALVFPGEEDFGIVPVEMQACGGPVIGYAKGGLLETVQAGETGEFFGDSTAESLIEAIARFERATPHPEAARQNALRFNRERFKNEMKALIEKADVAKVSCQTC